MKRKLMYSAGLLMLTGSLIFAQTPQPVELPTGICRSLISPWASHLACADSDRAKQLLPLPRAWLVIPGPRPQFVAHLF